MISLSIEEVKGGKLLAFHFVFSGIRLVLAVADTYALSIEKAKSMNNNRNF
ncbi:MAG: hypothetical protein K8R68_03200 [Bacteroidales bacterium]|nr:hypothetical protein [Bacteroidales bacterium]